MGSGDKPGTSCQLSIATKCRRCVPVKKKLRRGEIEGNVASCSPEHEHICVGSLVLKLLNLSCRQES